MILITFKQVLRSTLEGREREGGGGGRVKTLESGPKVYPGGGGGDGRIKALKSG